MGHGKKRLDIPSVGDFSTFTDCPQSCSVNAVICIYLFRNKIKKITENSNQVDEELVFARLKVIHSEERQQSTRK